MPSIRCWKHGLMLVAVFVASPGCLDHRTQAQAAAQPIRVAATVPELASLVREVGGDEVAVMVFAKGTEDPHFVEAKPMFIKQLSQDDLYVQVGLELELGWAPVLLQNARNARVLPVLPATWMPRR